MHLRDLPYFRAMLRAVEAEYYQNADLPGPTLDLGCGDGHFASLVFASALNRKLEVGLDPWGPPIQEARQRGGYLSLVQGDAGQMPFPDGSFASAISNSVLEHIPQIDQVLAETGRVLKPGAPFLFCVPNPRYLSELSVPQGLRRIGLKGPAEAYREWFRVMSRVHHADDPEVWQQRLEGAGFRLEKWWHYFSPAAMRALEWGHYWGAPTLLPHALFGRWIIAAQDWNLALTRRYVERFIAGSGKLDALHPQGVFTFYIARKTAG